ncbi:MAG TPA: class I SAM-dependent methyltransferase family protein [Candidatus Methanoperedens sp.]
MKSLCIKVPKEDGEMTRKKLIELGAINRNLKIKSEGENLLIPVICGAEGLGTVFTEDFGIIEKEESIAQLLGYTPAYEQIGDIALIDRHEPDAQKIAEALVRQKKIKTVLRSETPVDGEFRTRGLSIIAGEEKTETLYRENGCRYRLDISRVYFTPRLSTERMRIAEQIHPGDRIVDMFAGVGPFSILIAKKFPSAHVIAIDKNPDAIKYLKENIKLNKVSNIDVREGDAREAVKGITDVDHVIMNLPHTGIEFLGAALEIIRKGGIVHLYAISHEDCLFDELLRKITKIAGSFGLEVIPVCKRIVRPYAPYQHNICIDFKVI